MKEKVTSLSKAVDLIKDGMLLATSGNAMHRNPTLFSLALTLRPVKELKVCGAAPGIAADILFATNQADTAYFGFFGLENEAGLAPGMRKSMQDDGPARAIEGS
jgi:acyl CoA:acetate/3-ketoacid CoA transferase alpha subunit